MKTRILLAIFCAISVTTFAAVEEVTLTTVGDGTTREEAVNNALRSALEQAYGAFMSSSAIVLDDEIKKDEIVSVTSGNIKSYKVLGYAETSDGLVTTTCVSTVSLSKLLGYMESKGAEVTFSGASFAANLQLEELNRQSEEKAIAHLIETLQKMRGLCDYELKLNEPTAEGDMCKVTGRIYFKYNSQGINYGILLYNTLAQLHTPDGKYPVPNLGNFRLRNPLPKILNNELELFKDWVSYWYDEPYAPGVMMRTKFNDVIFAQDMLSFTIYDNNHPDIETAKEVSLLFGEIRACFTDKTTVRASTSSNIYYVYYPYACIPSLLKISRKELPDNQSHPFLEDSELVNKSRQGTLEVRAHNPYPQTSTTSTTNDNNAESQNNWWQELNIPFIYMRMSGTYLNTYAQVGDAFAYIPIVMRIPISEIGKFSVFGIKFDPEKIEHRAFGVKYDPYYRRYYHSQKPEIPPSCSTGLNTYMFLLDGGYKQCIIQEKTKIEETDIEYYLISRGHVQFTILPDGSIHDIMFGRFPDIPKETAALVQLKIKEAIKSTQWKPGRDHGKAVCTSVSLEIPYYLIRNKDDFEALLNN